MKNCLVEKFGIDGARLEAESCGLTRPIAGNATPEGRRQNRRVIVIVMQE